MEAKGIIVTRKRIDDCSYDAGGGSGGGSGGSGGQ